MVHEPLSSPQATNVQLLASQVHSPVTAGAGGTDSAAAMLEMLSTATLAAAVFAAVGVLESSSSPPQAAAKSVARVMHETMSFTWVLRREMRACVSAAGAGFFRPVRASQSKLMRRGFPRQGPGHARETPGAIG